jgi:hypothetical protein
MSEEIILEFLEDGQIKMEGKGFQGKSCDEAMAVFEQALGFEEITSNQWCG